MIGDWVYKFIDYIFNLLYRLNRMQDRLEFVIGNILDPAPSETDTEGLPAYCQRLTPRQALRYTKYYYLSWRDSYLRSKDGDISKYGKKDRKILEELKEAVEITYLLYQKNYFESKERVRMEKELK